MAQTLSFWEEAYATPGRATYTYIGMMFIIPQHSDSEEFLGVIAEHIDLEWRSVNIFMCHALSFSH